MKNSWFPISDPHHTYHSREVIWLIFWTSLYGIKSQYNVFTKEIEVVDNGFSVKDGVGKYVK